MTPKQEENTFVAVTAAAFGLHFLVAQLYPSFTWIDEVFQTLEQGHRLMWGYGVVPWEFRDGVRSWVLPGLLGLVMRATAGLKPGSTGYLVGVRMFLCVCSVVPVVVAMAWARRAKVKHWWAAGLATAVWFELVFFASKALTEVFAAYAVAVALYFGVAAREADPPRRAALWSGIAWGFAVGFRMHLAPAAAFAIVYTCRRDLALWKQLLPGAAGVFLAFGLLDAVTWSYPFQSYFLNFWVNVVEGKAATFGVAPPWEYLRSFAVVWSWGAVPLLVLAGLGVRRWPLPGWVALIVLVSHSAIAHKEYRFLVPVLVAVVVVASVELARLLESKPALGLAACVVFAGASLDGARRYDFHVVPPRIKSSTPRPMWSVRSGEISAVESLSTNDEVCGLAGVAVGWGSFGGYTYLHKDVPLYDVQTLDELKQHQPHFNFLVSLADNADKLAPYVIERCWGSTCVYKREGPCEPPGEYHINRWLAASGM